MEQLANLYSTTLAAPYVAGSGAITVASAGSYTSGTFSLTILDGAGNVILIFRVTSVVGPVFSGASEGPDANAPSGSTVVGSMLTAASIAQLFADNGPVSGQYITSGGNFFSGPTLAPATLPVAADFAWVNQGTGIFMATETPVGGGLVLHTPPAGSTELRMRVQNIGADTTLVTIVVPDVASQAAENLVAGVGFYESATGKVEGVWLVISGDIANLEVNRYSSPSGGFAGNQFNTGNIVYPTWLSIKLVISGGMLTFTYSFGGRNFPVCYSEAVNAFFTVAPDQWFYAVDAEGLNQDAFLTLLSWDQS